MPWARASDLERGVHCPGSLVLPRLGTKSQAAVDGAAWGDIVHNWKETGEWTPDTLPTRRRQAALIASSVSRDSLWPDNGEHEVAFAIGTKNRLAMRADLKTRAERDQWKFSLGSEWLVGTLDYLGDVLGNPWVDDLKTGNPMYLPADPWDMWQMRVYATAALMLMGGDRVYVTLTRWPRYPADGVPVRDSLRAVSREEVFGVTLPMLELIRQRREASLIKPETVVGEQCRFCLAQPGCPEYTSGPNSEQGEGRA